MTTTPLAVGEVLNTLWDCDRLIAEGLIDYIRTTIVHGGGITHVRRIADFAAHYHVRTGFHGAQDISPGDDGRGAAFRPLGAQLRHPGIPAAPEGAGRRGGGGGGEGRGGGGGGGGRGHRSTKWLVISSEASRGLLAAIASTRALCAWLSQNVS